jgi:hypothetical protein
MLALGQQMSPWNRAHFTMQGLVFIGKTAFQRIWLESAIASGYAQTA